MKKMRVPGKDRPRKVRARRSGGRIPTDAELREFLLKESGRFRNQEGRCIAYRTYDHDRPDDWASSRDILRAHELAPGKRGWAKLVKTLTGMWVHG
jgi:hypothetical protein